MFYFRRWFDVQNRGSLGCAHRTRRRQVHLRMLSFATKCPPHTCTECSKHTSTTLRRRPLSQQLMPLRQVSESCTAMAFRFLRHVPCRTLQAVLYLLWTPNHAGTCTTRLVSCPHRCDSGWCRPRPAAGTCHGLVLPPAAHRKAKAEPL